MSRLTKTRLVENTAVSQERMAYRLGIDEKTLRKNFRAELDNGIFKAHMAIGKGIFLMATQSSDEKVRADMSKYYASRQMPNFPLLARASLSRAMRSGK
jgi:hypothetical protein